MRLDEHFFASAWIMDAVAGRYVSLANLAAIRCRQIFIRGNVDTENAGETARRHEGTRERTACQ